MARRHGVAWRLAAVALLVAGCGEAPATQPTAPPPLAVVNAFTGARNSGDIDAAISLLGAEGDILGLSLTQPGVRDRLRANFAAQQVAHWTIEERNCVVEGVNVACDYRQTDDILEGWGLALTGEHRYVVRDGRITHLRRIHDPRSQHAVYAAADAFRAWISEAHPELLDVIWVDPTSALYTTPDGARAILEVLPEYDDAAGTTPPG
jgi:hypothetical protein